MRFVDHTQLHPVGSSERVTTPVFAEGATYTTHNKQGEHRPQRDSDPR